MCSPVTCRTCGKTTWSGCGHHVDQVMRGIPDQSAAKGTRKNPARGSSRACSPADHPTRKDDHMTTGDPDAQRKILHRLRRARGQLDAVISAVEQDKPCRDVVTQLAAVSSALDRAGFAIVSTAMKECVATPDAERGDNDLTTEELEKLFLMLA